MGPWFPPGLRQPKWKYSCPSRWPLCGNPTTPSHLPDTMANARCHLSPGASDASCHPARSTHLYLLPSSFRHWSVWPCLKGTSKPIAFEQHLMMKTDIPHSDQFSCIPLGCQTTLLSRIGANSFKEFPLIKRRSNLAQVFLRGYTICHVEWMCIFYFESILYSKRKYTA